MSWFKNKKNKQNGSSNKKKTPSGGGGGGGGHHSQSSSMAQLDDQLNALMEQLNIPVSGRAGMLKMPVQAKEKILESYKEKLTLQQQSKRKKPTGREWAKKLRKSATVTLDLLKQFTVVLNDSDVRFSKTFMAELGLNHVCRVSVEKHGDKHWDYQVLTIVKALIDTSPDVLQIVIKHEKVIWMVSSKVDTDDSKVRAIAIKLLFLMVVIEGESAHMASVRIMEGLLEQARVQGYRNRWRSVVRHISVNLLSGGSFEYDNYALGLINYVINELDELEQRTDERRLLNSLKFQDTIAQLKQAMENAMRSFETAAEAGDDEVTSDDEQAQAGGLPKMRSRRLSTTATQVQIMATIQALTNQLKVYETLRRDDRNQLSEQGFIDDENDLTSPNGLFKKLNTQVMEDGFINEFTAMLKNMITLPSNAEQVWSNIARIVSEACKPTQAKMLASSSTPKNSSQNYGSNNALSGNIYPSFEQLQTLLAIKDADDSKQENTVDEGLLNAEKLKVSTLEKQLQQLSEQVIELKKHPIQMNSGSTGGLPSPNNNNNNNNNGGGGGLPSPNNNNNNSGGGGLPPPPNAAPAPTPAAPVTDDGLNKYRKMLKMRIPAAAVANKMRQAGIDGGIIAQLEESGQLPGGNTPAAAAAPAPAPAPVPVADDGLNKFRKLLKMHVPAAAVANKMRQSGIDKGIIEQFESSGQLPGGNTVAATAAPAPAPAPAASALTTAESIKLAKYLKMKKMKLPKQAILNKMTQDGIDKALQDKMFAADAGGGGSSGLPAPSPNASATARAPTIKAAKPPRPPVPPHLKPKKEIKPKRKMRNLQWKKIDPYDVDNSIWKNCDETRIKFNLTELELMFGSDQKKGSSKKSTSGGGSGRKKKKKAEVVRILDGKRSYNIEIFLGRMRMKPAAISDAIAKLDETVFSAEQVSKLEKFVPTPEECDMFDGMENEPNLGKAEHFFNIVRTVDKNLPQRMNLWAFKLTFDEQLQAESHRMEIMNNGYLCIKNSKSLKELFAIILAFGNYMNGGTRKGKAYGFKLASLQQLTRSRSIDNKTTLMEYLYTYLQGANPQLLAFVDEWAVLDEVVTIDVSSMNGSINKMNGKLNIIKRRMKPGSTDSFAKVMSKFLNHASKKMVECKTRNDELFKCLKTQAKWLNEKNDMQAVYFQTLNEFRKQFKLTIKQVEERKERERKKASRDAFNLSRKQKRNSGKLNTGKRSGGGGGGGGGGLPPPLIEQKEDESNNNSGRSQSQSQSPNKQFLSTGNSDALLASLMRQDSTQLLSKLKARRKRKGMR